MAKEEMTLNKVPVGKSCTVNALEMTGLMRRRLQDLGMIPGTRVTPTKKSPGHGPTAYKLRESVYALREEDARNVDVTLD